MSPAATASALSCAACPRCWSGCFYSGDIRRCRHPDVSYRGRVRGIAASGLAVSNVGLYREVRMHVTKLAVALVLLVSSAASAAWPEKPVRIIIPWAPGGSTDIVGRILAADLTSR